MFMRIFILILLCTACNSTPKSKVSSLITNKSGNYRWVKLYDSAVWPKSYNYQLFTVGDSLWVFHPKANWVSRNGLQFQQSDLPNAINNLAFLDYVPFNQSIFGLGFFDGNIEQYKFQSTIFQTTDFRKWNIVARTSNLPNRFFYHPFVFDNKIWIIGGEDKNQAYADIWNSADAVHWVKQKDNLPFGKRSNSKIVQLHNYLYLLNNDVWRSSDGLNWELITKSIIKDVTVFGYEAIVFDNKIWLLGCNRNEQFSSKVLFSNDGKNWSEMQAPWLPRGGIAATVFKNKLYMTGGKYGGTRDHPAFRYDNDLWVLEKQ